jgi:hypothetical protein
MHTKTGPIETAETETAPVEVSETILTLDKPCKHSNRFSTQDPDAPINSVYVLKGNLPGIKDAKKIAVAIRIVE